MKEINENNVTQVLSDWQDSYTLTSSISSISLTEEIMNFSYDDVTHQDTISLSDLNTADVTETSDSTGLKLNEFHTEPTVTQSERDYENRDRTAEMRDYLWTPLTNSSSPEPNYQEYEGSIHPSHSVTNLSFLYGDLSYWLSGNETTDYVLDQLGGYPYPSQYTWLHIISSAAVVTLIMLVIIIGNSLVIIAIVRDRHLKGLQNWFIASLAVSDLFVGFFVMPQSLAQELLGYWAIGTVMCDIWLSTDVLLCTASILNLVLISLDRYWSITRAISYVRIRTPKMAVGMIATVWILSIVISLPPLVGWKRPQPTKFGYPQCVLSEELGYVIYSTIGSFYIPLLVMVLVYLKIYLAARSRARRNLKPGTIQITVQDTNNKKFGLTGKPVFRSQRESSNLKSMSISTTMTSFGMSQNPNQLSGTTSRMDMSMMTTSPTADPTESPLPQYNMIPEDNGENPPWNIDREIPGGLFKDQRSSIPSEGSDSPKSDNSLNGKKISNRKNNQKDMILDKESIRCTDKTEPNTEFSNNAQISVITAGQADMGNDSSSFLQFTASSYCNPGVNPCASQSINQSNKNFNRSDQSVSLSFNQKPNTDRLMSEAPRALDNNESVFERLLVDQKIKQLNNQSARGSIDLPFEEYNNKSINQSRAFCDDKAGKKSSKGGRASQRRATASAVDGRRRTKKFSVPNLSISRRSFEDDDDQKSDPDRFRRRVARARERRATLVLGIVMASFIGCWLPFFLLYPISLLVGGLDIPPMLFAVIFWLGYCNSALNPIIYTIFNREFSAAFKRILFGTQHTRRGTR